MFNSKKNYVSPEVNVILVDKDIIATSNPTGGNEEMTQGPGIETPEIPMGK